ncbi:MAG: hypothetical protein A2900_03550 [Candidatus Chisholmbacteria bacterium RIFCSPLOWO2_01_FULL_50_28]|uniref:UDP-glucose/GDP-mannose dehydrogenase dimerisation domain-containing protein n=1 Tax=Candidatus Chisholmbacteria bacterium RIFCSPHIGHO2_01_FULL_52_32 TaxID=1797591 RepID=A0A1G1VSU4_9BACT|nr:MAG: hypothetical protein A2786_03195 [Candidatus Chisholmbacteria bacterium RIFCSPHIGHO2_01_FULL_52_32]OGY20151.1 MAG: hypothetical protein A2900_03550 [Candidatus Chisholmbacteria bacterium RIFCSPLOWO2_01_FULL_50_28]
MTIGVIGLGEVGSAIIKLCKKKHTVYGRNRSRDELKGKTIDILHICFGYSSDLPSIVIEAIRELRPKLVIIDSTVKPGTTQGIYQKTKVPIVHAPIVGKHPNLYRYLVSMPKVIGPINEGAYRAAAKHFNQLGVKTIRFRSPLESEMAKILETTYYGWNIIFEKFVHRICKKLGANHNEVYRQFNEIYNKGYERTLPNVRRPILDHFPGEIGGHCVVPNAEIIQGWLNDEFTAFLLSQNEKAKKEDA